jgi:hypothetical protein
MVRIIDVLNSSRRVLFENDYEGFEYSGSGSCFLCRYKGLDFVVTARHVVNSCSADALRVPFYAGAREFVPHNAQATVVNDDPYDTDWADLAIFPLERDLYSDVQFGAEPPYELSPALAQWSPELPGHLITRGFPDDLQFIDYNRAVIHEQGVILEADAIGRASMAHCVEIAFRDVSPCSTLNGLSGSPVFWLSASKPHNHVFVGILLRATHSSRRGFIVQAHVLFAALENLVTGNRINHIS